MAGSGEIYPLVMQTTGHYNNICRREKRQGVIIMEKGIQGLKERVKQADAVITGAGCSAAAGFARVSERFDRRFSDPGRKYGFRDTRTLSPVPEGIRGRSTVTGGDSARGIGELVS